MKKEYSRTITGVISAASYGMLVVDGKDVAGVLADEIMKDRGVKDATSTDYCIPFAGTVSILITDLTSDSGEGEP